MDAATIVSLSIPVVMGLYGAIFNRQSMVKETCIDNYSRCIMEESEHCDKILEVCKGQIKIEKSKDETSNLPSMQGEE